MEATTDMTLDDFWRWKVPQLREFLRARKLKVTGSKPELCALAYGATQAGREKATTADENKAAKARLYRELLKNGEVYLPDPFSLKQSEWISEPQGYDSWPPTMHVDIAEYLLCSPTLTNVADSLRTRLMSDYKEGKAYSYFASGWLSKILFHPISPSSEMCFLQATCTPSENVKHTPHRVWIAIE